MDSNAWVTNHQLTNDSLKSLTAAEIIPVSVLAIEAALGVVFNLAALLTYSQQKRRMLQNPGNIFTVSLIIDDLILSGIATPIVIAFEASKTSTATTVVDNLCLCARCVVLFSAVSSATGNALLALDRGDQSLRPSKRFFRPKKAVAAVVMAWLCSVVSLFVPVLSSWASHEKTLINQTLYLNSRSNSVLQSTGQNTTLQCNASCYDNHCAVTKGEFAVQCTIQFFFYFCAAITIVYIYTTILQSVKKRDVRRATPNIGVKAGFPSSSNKTKLYLSKWCLCCNRMETETLVEEKADMKQACHGQASSAAFLQNFVGDQSRLTDQQLTHLSSSNVKSCTKLKNHNCKETSSFLTVQDDLDAGLHPGRAHFASVALSVQAFIALKRIVREKTEIRRRQHRHLQRMTSAITTTFLLCWTPFHVLPFVRLAADQIPESYATCNFETCVDNNTLFETNNKAIVMIQNRSPLSIAFLWALVFASASSIANPLLYTFSREKIRQDFRKVFCNKYNGSPSTNGTGITKSTPRESRNSTAGVKWKKATLHNLNITVNRSDTSHLSTLSNCKTSQTNFDRNNKSPQNQPKVRFK